MKSVEEDNLNQTVKFNPKLMKFQIKNSKEISLIEIDNVTLSVGLDTNTGEVCFIQVKQ